MSDPLEAAKLKAEKACNAAADYFPSKRGRSRFSRCCQRIQGGEASGRAGIPPLGQA